MSRGLTLMEVMGMNRHARRALAKANGKARVRGSQKPFVKPNDKKK